MQVLKTYPVVNSVVYKPEGEPGVIKKLYQKYHQCEGFIPGADLDFMLRYLYKKEEYEAVGSYFRNMRMAEYEGHPESYEEICRKRGSHMEGNIGCVKLIMLLDDHPGRRG